jgi:hypothetical protein
MSHTNNKGTVWYCKDRRRWVAQFQFPNGKRSYYSPYRQDCERWIEGVRGKGSAEEVSRVDMEMVRREIGGDPKQVPGFPNYIQTEDDRLFKYKNGRVIEMRIGKNRAYYLSDQGRAIGCNVDKLRFCVDKGISPTTISHCKLSVERGEDGMMLMDITDRIQKSIRRNKDEFLTKHSEEYLQMTEEWCHNVLEVHRGNMEAIIHLRRIIERMRPELERYIRTTLRQTGVNKLKFMVEEVESETLHRAIERTAAVCAPWNYMRHLCRNLHYRLMNNRGKVIKIGNNFRVIGGTEKLITDKLISYK